MSTIRASSCLPLTSGVISRHYAYCTKRCVNFCINPQIALVTTGYAGIQVPLSGLINLESVTKLRIFSIYMVINCDGEFDVVKDVNTVLRIIPESNQLFHIAFDFSILSKGKNILPGCMNQDWAGLVEQIKRLSADRYLELDIKTTVSAGLFGEKKIDEENIYNFIKEIMAPLSQCPQICQHIWDSTCWGRGMAPLPLGQSRMRCKRWAT